MHHNVSIPKELSEVIQDGLAHGVSEEQIVKGMISIGNFAGEVTAPDNPEEGFVKAMWNEAKPDEKEMLARIVLRIGKRQNR